jgi:hypothetical protein
MYKALPSIFILSTPHSQTIYKHLIARSNPKQAMSPSSPQRHIYLLCTTTFHPNHPNNATETITCTPEWEGEVEHAYITSNQTRALLHATSHITEQKRLHPDRKWRAYTLKVGEANVWRWWPASENVPKDWKHPELITDYNEYVAGKELDPDVEVLGCAGGVFWLWECRMMDLYMLEGDE